MCNSSDYYKISTSKGLTYAATFLLVQMHQADLQISTEKLGDDYQLNPALQLLIEKNHIVADETSYRLQESGKYKAIQFQERYSTALTYIDIFGFIDLDQGEFAYAHYNDCPSEEAWDIFKSEQRWSDIRIAMFDHLDGDSTELVYAQLLLEKHLHPNSSGWQQNLIKGKWWRELAEMCNSAIQMEDLEYQQEQELVTGEQVLDDIYDQALVILKELYPNDLEIQNNLNTWFNDTPDAPNRNLSLIQPSTTPPWASPWTLG